MKDKLVDMIQDFEEDFIIPLDIEGNHEIVEAWKKLKQQIFQEASNE